MPDKLPLKDVTPGAAPVPETPDTEGGLSEFAPDQVGPGKKVSMHFSLSLENGEVVDSNFDKEPVSFKIGDGNLLPGFEQALFGLRAGEKTEQVLPPSQAFGDLNPDNVMRYPRSQFDPELPLTRGLVLGFSDSAGNEQAGVIKGFGEDGVDVDFNHPLAGREIRFTAQILRVEPATDKAD